MRIVGQILLGVYRTVGGAETHLILSADGEILFYGCADRNSKHYRRPSSSARDFDGAAGYLWGQSRKCHVLFVREDNRAAGATDRKSGERDRPDPSRQPLFTDLRTGRINAHVLFHNRSRKYIVVLNDDVFTFALLAAKVFALAIPEDAWDADKTSITRLTRSFSRIVAFNREAEQRFIELFLSYLTTGKTGSAPSYTLQDQRRRGMASLIIDATELFLVGHEYGHMALGHIESNLTVRSAFSVTGTDELTYQHEQELEADANGIQLALASLNLGDGDHCRWDAEWAFAGIAFLFTALELLERGRTILQTGKEGNPNQAGESKSHPSFRRRRKSLEATLNASLGDLDEEIFFRALQLTALMDGTFTLMFERLAPFLKKLHDRGDRPSSAFANTSYNTLDLTQ